MTVLSVTSSYLSAHKSTTTGVWVIGGGMFGAIKAEQQQGINPPSIPVAGPCIPSDVPVDVDSGLIKNCLLWSPADTAYADLYAINAAIKGKLPANGTLKAGRLGTLTARALAPGPGRGAGTRPRAGGSPGQPRPPTIQETGG